FRVMNVHAVAGHDHRIGAGRIGDTDQGPGIPRIADVEGHHDETRCLDVQGTEPGGNLSRPADNALWMYRRADRLNDVLVDDVPGHRFSEPRSNVLRSNVLRSNVFRTSELGVTRLRSARDEHLTDTIG